MLLKRTDPLAGSSGQAQCRARAYAFTPIVTRHHIVNALVVNDLPKMNMTAGTPLMAFP